MAAFSLHPFLASIFRSIILGPLIYIIISPSPFSLPATFIIMRLAALLPPLSTSFISSLMLDSIGCLYFSEELAQNCGHRTSFQCHFQSAIYQWRLLSHYLGSNIVTLTVVGGRLRQRWTDISTVSLFVYRCHCYRMYRMCSIPMFNTHSKSKGVQTIPKSCFTQ